MSRILVVSMRIPYPLLSGYQVTMFNYLVALSDLGFEIDLFCIEDAKNPEANIFINVLKEQIPGIKRVGFIRIPLFICVPSAMLGLLKGLPFQVGYFSNFLSKLALKRFINNNSYKHILIHSSRLVEVIPVKWLAESIIFFADSLAMNFYARYKQEKSIKRFFYKIESDRMKSYEQSVSLNTKIGIFHNEIDIQFLEVQEKSHVIPILKHPITEYVPINAHTKKRFLFIGKMSYKPNIDAIKYIVKALYENPSIDFDIDLIGDNLSDSLLELVNNTQKMHYLGPVKELSAEILDSYGILSPINTGAGMTNKILDAIVHGRPAIASEFSAVPYFYFLKKSGNDAGILTFGNTMTFFTILNRLIHDLNYTNAVCKQSLETGKLFSISQLPDYLKEVLQN